MNANIKAGLEKLWSTWKLWVINGFGIIAVLICISSVTGGDWFNPFSNLMIFAFGYATWWVMTRFGVKLNPAVRTVKSTLWYWGVFVGGWLLINMFFSHVLEAMYIAWADYDRSFWGFTQCFSPIILVLVSAIWVCAISNTPRVFSRRFLIIAGILGVMGFVGYELLGPGQEYIAAKKIATAQALAGNSVNTAKEAKIVAEVAVPETKVYKHDSTGRYFDPVEKIVLHAGLQLPLYNGIKDREKDGPIELIKVWLPDKNFEFTGRSPTGYVRVEDVKIVKIAINNNGFILKKSEDGKLWEVTFTSNEPVTIKDTAKGEKINISGMPFGKLFWPDIKDESRLIPVPMGIEMENQRQNRLVLKGEKGYSVTIKFTPPKKT